jgi:hypothetical protein
MPDITAADKKLKTYDIVVNAQQHTVANKEISFAEVVTLAYGADATNPDKTFTVSYRKSDNNKHDGTLAAGDSVKIKDGTVFSVTSTTRS